jgi:hypothetical protein
MTPIDMSVITKAMTANEIKNKAMMTYLALAYGKACLSLIYH